MTDKNFTEVSPELSPPKHILGMEPDSVARQMIRNHFARCSRETRIEVEDCVLLMLQFKEWLVGTNETLQKLVLDKINTELPAPILPAPPSSPSPCGENEMLEALEKRPMSSWSNEEALDYARKTGQFCKCPGAKHPGRVFCLLCLLPYPDETASPSSPSPQPDKCAKPECNMSRDSVCHEEPSDMSYHAFLDAPSPSGPDPGPQEQLTHTRSCPALTPGNDESCTCGLRWRVELQTEQTMHGAWQKRAEEAEKELAEIRHELVQCDDIVLNQPSANIVCDLQKYRERLRGAASPHKDEPKCTCPEKVWAEDGSGMNDSTCEIDHVRVEDEPRPPACKHFWSEGNKAYGCVLPEGHTGDHSAFSPSHDAAGIGMEAKNTADGTAGNLTSMPPKSLGADEPSREAFIALEKEWMAQTEFLDYRNWLQDELIKARGQARLSTEAIPSKDECAAKCPLLHEWIEKYGKRGVELVGDGWQLAHDPGICGHPRACWLDRNYPESERNYNPDTHSSDPPIDYRCIMCESEQELDDLKGVIAGLRDMAEGKTRPFTEIQRELESSAKVSPEAIPPHKLAELFHETYERLAPMFDYKTREASAVPWVNVPVRLQQLMTAVCAEILATFPSGVSPEAIERQK